MSPYFKFLKTFIDALFVAGPDFNFIFGWSWLQSNYLQDKQMNEDPHPAC